MLTTDDRLAAVETARFEIVPAALLPAGQIALPLEVRGQMVWAVAEGEMTPQARDEINAVLRHLLGSGLWRQRWDGRVEHAPDGPSRAWFRIVSPDVMPDGRATVPLEKAGAMMWAIREGAVSPEACREINDLLAHILGSGLWDQAWAGRR